VGDQPRKRNRYDRGQYRKSNPEHKRFAPHWITDAQELWPEPLNHSGRIGNFFFKLYRARASASRS
jgi:hypothetical protein